MILLYTKRPERSDYELNVLTRLRSEGKEVQFRTSFSGIEECDVVVSDRKDVRDAYRKFAKVKTLKQC